MADLGLFGMAGFKNARKKQQAKKATIFKRPSRATCASGPGYHKVHTALLVRKNSPFLFLLLFIIVSRLAGRPLACTISLVDAPEMEASASQCVGGEASSMGVPYLTSFLWCMSLKVGSRITSVMHFLFSTTVVLAAVITAVEASQYVGTEDDVDRVYTQTFYVTIVVAVISFVHVVLACVLFYGVFWRKASLLRVWVLVMLALYASALLLLLAAAAVCGLSATGSDIFLNFLQAVLVFGFIGYCILCVYSYYLMLRSAEDLDHPNKIDY